MQVELFPTRPEPDKKPAVLEGINPREREAVVVFLARLMGKAIRPTTNGGDGER